MDAYEYADLISRLLNSCRFLDEPPHFTSEIQIPIDTILIWKDKISFQDGYVLAVEDRVLFDINGMMSHRRFTYDFRRPGDENPVFRFDTHGEFQDIDGPCHVHDEDEDVTIEFPTCDGIDFAYVMRCIKRHFLHQPQDWKAQ